MWVLWWCLVGTIANVAMKILDIILHVHVRQGVCVRIAMAGWLHGVFVGDWLFVFPLCGFSLSLFCNYTCVKAVLSVVLGPWSVRFVGWANWVDCRCFFFFFLFLGVARRLELSPCNT